MVYVFLRKLSEIALRLFYHLRVEGRHTIPRKGGFLVASNHVSYLDPIVVGVACNRKLNYMARNTLFKNFWFGQLLYSLHVFPVKRDTADLASLKEAIRRVKSNSGLLLFPEGRRMTEGVSEQPKAGIGFLANKLKVPVIPAFVRGTDQVLPKGEKKLKSGSINVRFGKPIYIQEGQDYHDFALVVMSAIKDLSGPV